MKHILSENDRLRLDKLIAEAEAKTRSQIVLATARRSDSYPEIPWKAFAIGTSVSGFVVFLIDLLMMGWISDAMILLSVASVLVAGALLALLSIALPRFARLFLSENRRESETLQYAESLFLSREIFATDRRGGILLLVSLFERQVVILPDKGVRGLLTNNCLDEIISKMTQHLSQNDVAAALETGLKELVTALGASDTGSSGRNELSNEIIEGDSL